VARQRKSEVEELRHTTAATTCFHISNWIHRWTDPTSTATTLCKQYNDHTTDDVTAVTCPACLVLLRGTGEELATLTEE
jgi:hypothetical protein